MELKLCAMKSGFALIQRSSKSTKQLQKLNLTCYLTLQCQHGIKFHGRNRNFDQVCKTKYCYHSDNLCNFRLNVSLCAITNKWRIHNSKTSQRGKQSLHSGHFKLSPSHIHTNIQLLPPEELQLAKQCNQLHLSGSTMASLISIQNALGISNTWTRHQISYKAKIIEGIVAENDFNSSAKKLIHMFDSRNDVNYLYILFKPQEGLTLMTSKYYEFMQFHN